MGVAIECTDVSKTYPGGVTALRDVDLSIQAGQVYGLVGRNGAGKTTLMRILVGLVEPTGGSAGVLGEPVGGPANGALVGSLIEAPAFYPYLSGRGNLTLLARYLGCPREQVDQVLDDVGLTERARSRYSAYSLGMKQRLGIAAALLGDPPVLILDEPVNGLDPQAMAHVRGMLSRIREEGRTVLLSSHLLAELEQICDRVAVLHEGAILAEGTPTELRRGAAQGAGLLLEVSEPQRAAAVLDQLPGVTVVGVVNGSVRAHSEAESTTPVMQALLQAGIEVRSVSQGGSLEEAYLTMTGDPDAQSGHAVEEGDR